jgi:hypothetical protein
MGPVFQKGFVAFEARSICSRPEINPELYGASFQSVNIDPKYAEIIKRAWQIGMVSGSGGGMRSDFLRCTLQ